MTGAGRSNTIDDDGYFSGPRALASLADTPPSSRIRPIATLPVDEEEDDSEVTRQVSAAGSLERCEDDAPFEPTARMSLDVLGGLVRETRQPQPAGAAWSKAPSTGLRLPIVVQHRLAQPRTERTAARWQRRTATASVFFIGAAAVIAVWPLGGGPPAHARSMSREACTPALAPILSPLGDAVPEEMEARRALTRLREGLRDCVHGTIGVLPGTSPAVPESLGALRTAPYRSTRADWRTPVWSCANFAVDGPQRFQIQWQLTRANTRGRALAWIDRDKDGQADAAWGFEARLRDHGDVELGEVTAVDSAYPTLRTRGRRSAR